MLKAEISKNTATSPTDKTDRSPFVSSVSTPSGHIPEKKGHLSPYSYRLKNGDGGIFLIRTTCLDQAQMKLKQRYGDDLALIVKAGTKR